jgi:hypothetical protein
VARKPKSSAKAEDAEVVETIAAEEAKSPEEDIAQEEPASQEPDSPEPVDEPFVTEVVEPDVAEPEAAVIAHDEDDHNLSLSTRVLRGLGLIAVGIGLALWGAPKLAPLLPAGLSPVAEFLMPGRSEAKADVSALRTEVESRLSELASVPKDSVNQEAIDAAISAYDAKNSAELAELKDRLATTDGQDIEARIAKLETQVEGINAELKAVGDRLSLQITENGAALSEEAASKLSGYQVVLEGLKAQIADLAAKSGALNQKIEDVAQASNRRVEEAEKMATTKVVDTATKKLLTDVSVALDNGTPFKTALDGLVELTKIEAPSALAAIAETGTPGWSSLRNSFSETAQAALRADAVSNSGTGVMGKFGAFLKSQVGKRSLERQEGTGTDAILSRIEDDLANRRLSAALSETESLPETPKAAMAGWIANLTALTHAQTALDELNAALRAT